MVILLLFPFLVCRLYLGWFQLDVLQRDSSRQILANVALLLGGISAWVAAYSVVSGLLDSYFHMYQGMKLGLSPTPCSFLSNAGFLSFPVRLEAGVRDLRALAPLNINDQPAAIPYAPAILPSPVTVLEGRKHPCHFVMIMSP